MQSELDSSRRRSRPPTSPPPPPATLSRSRVFVRGRRCRSCRAPWHDPMLYFSSAFLLRTQTTLPGLYRSLSPQTKPKLYTTRHSPSSRGPLLHLPLAFPTASSRPLTSWTTVSLDLPSLLPAFSSLTPSTPGDDAAALLDAGPAQVPAGQFSHISYIKIYANCRLKRIWVSDTKTTPSTTLPWEFELYGS